MPAFERWENFGGSHVHSGKKKKKLAVPRLVSPEMDGLLDFEIEDPLLDSPYDPSPKRRRVKLIGLDELVKDHYDHQNKLREKEIRRAKLQKARNLEEEDDHIDIEDASLGKKEAFLSDFVQQCQKQVEDIKAENDIALWGLRVFGDQNPPPPLSFPQLGSCSLLQSITGSEINSILQLTPDKGQNFLEEVLINGWLSELVVTCGHVEESVATWTLNLMLYSSCEDLRTSACDFWCTILSHKDEVIGYSKRLFQDDHKKSWFYKTLRNLGQDCIQCYYMSAILTDKKAGLFLSSIEGFPSYTNLKSALQVYGYLLDSPVKLSSLPEMCKYFDLEGPPQNIRLWVKFVAVCCQARCSFSIFSNNSEVEELLGVIISFFLERRLQGLSMLLYECMLSVISFFTDSEWCFSCERVARSLATRTEKDLNCLRLVECISGVDARSKQLRREVAFQSLKSFLHLKASDPEDMLSSLMSINVKGESSDFSKLYVDLVLTEYWLFSNPLLEEKPKILDMWVAYLRICSCQIPSTDMRSYASKVRNKASFILQSTAQGYVK